MTRNKEKKEGKYLKCKLKRKYLYGTFWDVCLCKDYERNNTHKTDRQQHTKKME